MNITFNNTSLMADPYRVRSFTMEETNNKEVFLYDLARQRGANLVTSQYRQKRFLMIGTIIGDDKDDLEANIDSFKALMDQSSKNLDIDYSGTTRRFLATAVRCEVKRDYFNMTFAPFEIEFVVPAGVGYETARTEDTLAGITDLTQNESITIGGSVPPDDFQLTVTFTAENAITQMDFQANGNKITLTPAGGFNNGDIVVFDQENMKVTLNGTEVAYTGLFPQFYVGANAFLIELTGTSATYTRKTSYTKSYA